MAQFGLPGGQGHGRILGRLAALCAGVVGAEVNCRSIRFSRRRMMMVMHGHRRHSGLGRVIASRPFVHRQTTQWQGPRGQHPECKLRDKNASSDAHGGTYSTAVGLGFSSHRSEVRYGAKDPVCGMDVDEKKAAGKDPKKYTL